MKSLSLSQPHMLITVGIPGSGKSFFAKQFAATFGAPYVHYDTIQAISGQNGAISDTYAGYMLRELFKTKHTLLFDGPSATPAERAALKDLALSAGYACLFVWVQTDVTTAKARYVKDARKHGQHASTSQYDAIVRAFVPPAAKEGTTVVVSGKHTYATQARAVLKNLASTKQAARAEKPHSHADLQPSKRNIAIQ